MTNVKLKLIFHLINALLTNIVHSRPYSDDTYPQPRSNSQAYSSNSNFQPYSGNSNSQPYGNSNLQTYSGNSDSQPYSGTNSRYSSSADSQPYSNSNFQMQSDSHDSQLYSGNSDSHSNVNSQTYSGTSDSHSGDLNSRFSNPETQSPRNSQPSSGNSSSRFDNTTDIVIKFPTNNTFNIPVDPNSDTLVVASDDETPEETNISSNSNMEAIVNAEQDRDEGISVNRAREQQNPPELDKDDAEIEKQLNISSTLLEDIIDSEADRDESITDILFKPESEFVDLPRFEFLIAAKINESEFSGQANDSDSRNSSDVLKKVDYVELVEVGKALGGANKSAYMLNITGHEVDNDLAPDTRFTDVQTWFLACFGTLLPLLLLLCAVLFIRCLCRRYCPGFCRKPSASSASDSSEKPDQNHQQLKSPMEDGSSVAAGESPPANGSIFTMTLKNNHLIVETEERSDITKNGRETKMKYSPDNDGIFVVEVQQSTAYRPAPTKSALNSPPRDPEIPPNLALIHRPPDEERKEVSDHCTLADKARALSSTGLSISDLSMSSIGSHNVSYSYGSQVGYEQGPFGYPVYAGYDVKEEMPDGIITDNSQEPLICKTPADPDKPIVTAAIFKQDSIIGTDALQGPGYCLEGSTDGPLLSDVQAREYSLHHLQEQKKIENGVAVPITEKNESQKVLNRADSLPIRLEEEKVPEPEKPAMETITEDDPTKDTLKERRTSLPIIRTEMYESVKDAIHSTGSPKFEKLYDDSSPAESSFDSPPMITITEESESSKSEGTS